MSGLHEETKLTPKSVAMKTGFLDWGSQPSLFKRYPTFLFRYKSEDVPSLGWLFKLRHISSTHDIAQRAYHRLNVPSAGNLHPLELYVQIRGIKGVLSGIYHLDVLHEELVLIRDLEKDGVEPALDIERRLRGVIVMVSLVPFRSYWKYGLRSWRYLYLDAGHQLAQIAAISEQEGEGLTSLSHFDADHLGHVMGLEDKETICAVLIAGESSERKVEEIKIPLMHVLPTDYVEETGVLQTALKGTTSFRSEVLTLPQSLSTVSADELGKSRRSAREFVPSSLKKVDMERFMNLSLMNEKIDASFVVLRADGYASGVYHGRDLYREGMFDDAIVGLLVAQRFIGSAAVVIILHTASPEAMAHLESGVIGQWLYLQAEASGVACTGIGAYYDEALQKSLEIDGSILYVMALGVKV